MIRSIILAVLIGFAGYQIAAASHHPVPVHKSYPPDPIEEINNEFPFDQYLPLNNGTASEADVMAAEKYMHLPTWSAGYTNCDSGNSEVSCFEIVRAHKAILRYEKLASSGKTKGEVHINAAPYSLADRMSMLYHAFGIAMATNRSIFVQKSLYPFQLPDYIKESGDKITGIELPSDYQFGCSDISDKYPNILINNISWPQVLYTHHKVAPVFRDNFGLHAAYFIGNYLFGTSEEPDSSCKVRTKFAYEGHNFYDGNDMITPGQANEFILNRCGTNGPVSVVTNDAHTNFDAFITDRFLVDDENEKFICGLRKLVSAEKVIHTFGSRYGWWAAAMQGRKGGYVNVLDRICVNVANSQCASLWHTYCPIEKNTIFRTNNRMFVCGPNANDVRLYIDYLLW